MVLLAVLGQGKLLVPSNVAEYEILLHEYDDSSGLGN